MRAAIAPRSLDTELDETALIEEADGITHCITFDAGGGEPVLFAVAVLVGAVLAVGGEPIGPFPPGEFAKDGACRFDAVVNRRDPLVAGAFVLAEGPMHCIEKTEAFRDPLGEVSRFALEGKRATNVYSRQIGWRKAVSYPVRQHPADAAGRLQTDRVESCGDETTVHVGGLAEVIHPVGL